METGAAAATFCLLAQASGFSAIAKPGPELLTAPLRGRRWVGIDIAKRESDIMIHLLSGTE